MISYRDRYLLVDSGRENRWKDLSKELDGLGVNDKSLMALILTHSHFDHAENAANVKKKFKTTIIVQKNEADYLQRGDSPTIRGMNFITRFMADVFAQKLVQRYLRYTPADCDILVEERYDLNDLGFKGYIIHTPGHPPGPMSVILENEIAIVCDTIFGVFRESVFPPYADDPKLMIKSWEMLLNTGCSVYLPAHGTGTKQRPFAAAI